MISLRVLHYLERGSYQLVAEVQRGSFHKLHTVLVHNDPDSSLLKHSGKDGTQFFFGFWSEKAASNVTQ